MKYKVSLGVATLLATLLGEVVGQEIRTLEVATLHVCLSFSPDGKTLASASKDNTIQLWEVATGRLLSTLAGHEKPVISLAFTPDGKHLVSGSNYSTKLWDLATGKELASHQSNWGSLAALSPDGKTFICGGPKHTVSLREVTSGKEVACLVGHWNHLSASTYYQDGKTLATGSWDQTIKLWDVAKKQERATLHGHTSWIYSLVFSPDGKTLASAGNDNTVRLWEVATGEERACYHNKVTILSLAFALDGKVFVGGSGEGTLLYDITSGKARPPLRISKERSGFVSSVAFSPDGNILATGNGSGCAQLWDFPNILKKESKPVREELSFSPKILEDLWTDLAGHDAAKAYQAIWKMVSTPQPTVSFLQSRLRPASLPDPQEIALWISELDSNFFEVREKATEELRKLGDLAGPALRKTLEGKASLEVRQRVERLLGKLEPVTLPDLVRALRAVEILENIGTPEAHLALAKLSQGAEKSRLTLEAKASLERLAKRVQSCPGSSEGKNKE